MRVRFALAAALAVAVLDTFAGQQPATPLPPERPFGRGIIEVRVTRTGTVEGISDVAVTLQGPAANVTAEQVSQMFTPSSSLSAAQRQQVDQTIKTGFDAGVSAATIANAAGRLQAQLLGQPAPAELPPGSPAPRPPADLTVVTDTDGRVTFFSLPPGRYTIRAQREGYFGTVTPGGGTGSTIMNGTITLKDTDEAPATLALAMMRGVVLGGRVRDPEGRPAPGITVDVLQAVYQTGRTLLSPVDEIQSDDRGMFRSFWLPPGDYYVSATPRPRSAAGSRQDTWAKTYFPGVVDARAAAPVTAAEGAELNGIDFALQAEAIGRISGRIVNPFKAANGTIYDVSDPATVQDGQYYLDLATRSGTVDGALLQALRKLTTPSATLYLVPHGPGADPTALIFQNVAPDRSNGEFEILGILPGVYDLLASVPTGAARSATISNTASIRNGETSAPRIEYSIFDPVSAAATAWGRVRVDVGKEALTNVTITIKAGLEVKVRVAVDGAPPPYTMAAPPQRGGIDAAVVNALIARGVPTSDALAASRAAATPGAGTQVPTPRVRLSLQPKDNAPVGAEASQASFDPSGVYVFPSVPQGSYRVQVAQLPAPENYVADIRLGDASIYDDGLLIDGPLPGDIEITIVSKGSHIQGAVANVENRPAANAAVALIPADVRRQNLALYKTARTNATGNFTLNGVAPGLYKLFAWEDAPNNAWQSAEFLSRYEQLGEGVTVMGGESLNTSLKVIPKNYGR